MSPEIATQIAKLINSHNKLVRDYSRDAILCRKNDILFEENSNGEVISCVECKKVQWYQYEICHLTVKPSHRKNGLGGKILNNAIECAKNNSGRIVQCTIRQGNTPSEMLFKKAGFQKVSIFHYRYSGNDVAVWQKVICPAMQNL